MGDFHESMMPAEGDVVVKGKKGLDAFPGTDLEAQLVANGIETVVLAGFLTNCCVESTMRTAYEKGFNVITLTDATATTSAAGQAVTEGSYGMFSTPMTVADFEIRSEPPSSPLWLCVRTRARVCACRWIDEVFRMVPM